MATDEIKILIEAEVGNALKNIGLVKSETEKLAKPSLFAQMKSNWLGLSAGIAGAMVGIKKAFDLAKEFADFEEQAEAMQDTFGVSANEVIKRMKEVSGGSISMKDAVSTATRAMALGVTTDIDKIAKLYTIAAVQGDKLGKGNAESFEMLVSGVGMGLDRQLKQLGINTKGWDEIAKSQGVAYDKTFILNKILADNTQLLKDNGTVVLSSADKFDKFKATIDDIKLVVGKGLLDEFGKLSDVIKLPVSESGGIKLIQKGIKVIGIATGLFVNQWIWFGEFLKTIWNVPLQSAKMFAEIMYNIATGEFKKAFNAPKDALDSITGQALKSFDLVKNGMKETKKQFEDLFKEEKIINKPVKPGGGGGGGGNDDDKPAGGLGVDPEAEQKKRDVYMDGLKKMVDEEIAILDVLEAKKEEDHLRELARQEVERNQRIAIAEETIATIGMVGDFAGAIMARAGADKKKQAKAEKAFNLLQVAGSTAVNVAKSTLTPWMIPWIVAQGILQAGTILAQPIPEFASGGSMVTSAPALFKAGDNGSGKERIDITPLDNNGQPMSGGSGNSTAGNTYVFHGYSLDEARNKIMRIEGRGAFR